MSSNSTAGLLAIAFFAILGAGFYAYSLNTDLNAAEVQLTNLKKDRDTWKLRLEQFQSQGKDDALVLQSCQAKVADLEAQVEASSKKKK